MLLPRPTDSWRSYQLILDRIPALVRTIAVSQRGHGDSDKPATGYRVADFADDVVALLDALHIEHAVLAGHSGSCLVARRVAIDAPERFAGLALEASPTTLRGDPAIEEFVTSVVSGLHDPLVAIRVVAGGSEVDPCGGGEDRSEWALMATVHNLNKPHRATG